MSDSITRLAPSPTGALHLGNARTFVLTWLLARQRGWRVLMRMEDLDGPRTKPGAADEAIDDLAWLGLTWDGPVVRQSERSAVYESALSRLIEGGAAYPCTCSRRDIELAASAPHADDRVTTYPGTCRGRWASAEQAAKATGRPVAWRLRVPDEPVGFHDEFAGDHEFDLRRTCGDFVIFRGEGLAAYQLAVVLDDAEAGVDAIVRGDDLLESTARQIHLRRVLGLRAEPAFWHLPLVIGPDGRRLAKRHGDTRLSYYRRRGVTPQRLLGLLGYWSGASPRRRPMELSECLDRFDVSRVPHPPVTFTPEDDAYLLATEAA